MPPLMTRLFGEANFMRKNLVITEKLQYIFLTSQSWTFKGKVYESCSALTQYKAGAIPLQQTELTQIKLTCKIMGDRRGTTFKILKLWHVKWEFLGLRNSLQKARLQEKCGRVNAASSFLESHKYFFLLEEYPLPLFFSKANLVSPWT